MVSAAGGFELSFVQDTKINRSKIKGKCDDRIGMVLGYIGLIKKQKVKSVPEIIIKRGRLNAYQVSTSGLFNYWLHG